MDITVVIESTHTRQTQIFYVTAKVKCGSVYAMKTFSETGDISARILDLGRLSKQMLILLSL